MPGPEPALLCRASFQPKPPEALRRRSTRTRHECVHAWNIPLWVGWATEPSPAATSRVGDAGWYLARARSLWRKQTTPDSPQDPDQRRVETFRRHRANCYTRFSSNNRTGDLCQNRARVGVRPWWDAGTTRISRRFVTPFCRRAPTEKTISPGAWACQPARTHCARPPASVAFWPPLAAAVFVWYQW
jgi:hypothetical protein